MAREIMDCEACGETFSFDTDDEDVEAGQITCEHC